MPPSYVMPYVKREKAHAAAICEAATRPSMRHVAVKSEAAQRALPSTVRGNFWFASARRSALQSMPT